MQRSYILFIGVLILGLCALAGCGGSGSGTVEGKVTVDGQPVSGGRVAFRSADGKNSAVTKISPDGDYRMLDVPCDTMKVTVTPPDKLERIKNQREASGVKAKGAKAPGAPAKSGGAEAVESAVKIPEKYQNPDTSGLTYTVTRGANVYNIEISSK